MSDVIAVSGTGRSMDAVCSDAVRLISEHLDPAKAVEELCEPRLDAKLLSEKPLHSCWEGILESIRTQASSSGQPVAFVATRLICFQLTNCWTNRSQGKHVLSLEEEARLARVRALVSELEASLLFLPQQFTRFISERLCELPLQVIISLHNEGLISLEELLRREPAARTILVSAVVAAGTAAEGEVHQQKILMQAVAHSLVELAIHNKSSETVEFLEQFPIAILASLLPATYSLVEGINDCPLVTVSEGAEMMSLLLQSAVREPQMSLMDVLPQQEEWKFAALRPSVVSFYAPIASTLESDLCVQLLQRAMATEELNWPSLLHFVVCFLNTSQSAAGKIKNLVQSLVGWSLSDCDPHQLRCALLLARQASLEGSHLFPSYAQWFKATFGDGKESAISGKKQLIFLLKCLTQLVPYEPVFALKAHVAHPPTRLAKCHSLLMDYSSLLSTRLQDLGESVQTLGRNEEEQMREATKDVQDTVAYFQAHHRIPQTLMEASIFRQPYFVGKFLPALLTPLGHQLGQRELVQELVRERKIPPKMLRNYEKEYSKFQSTGASTTDFTDTASSGNPMLSVLSELTSAVVGGKSFPTITKVLSKLSSLLDVEISSGTSTGLGVNETKLQVVDRLLSAVCEATAFQSSIPDTSYKWTQNFLSMLTKHTSLHLPLYLRLKELLSVQLSKMTPPQMMGVAVLVCELCCLSPSLERIEEDSQLLQTGREYCHSLLASLSHDSALCMAQTLRFGCMFIQHLILCGNTDTPIPPCLLNKMVYIFQREQFLKLHSSCSELSSQRWQNGEDVVEAVTSLMSSESFRTQWNTAKVQFGKWLSWELSLDPSRDYMAPSCRKSYQRDELYRHFLRDCSVQQLFKDTFHCVLASPRREGSTDGYSILQELCYRLPAQEKGKPSCLLETIEDVFATIGGHSREKAMECLLLASSLPPFLIFTNQLGQCEGVLCVASFIQTSLFPVLGNGMTLPLHVICYLSQGLMSLGESASQSLCEASPVYLASVVAHWPHLQHCTPHDVSAAELAHWIHSGIHSDPPDISSPFSSSSSSFSSSFILTSAVAVAVFHYMIHGDGGRGGGEEGRREGEERAGGGGSGDRGGRIIKKYWEGIESQKLSVFPPKVLVLIAECCVRRLAPHCAFQSINASSAELKTDVETLLRACLLREPSAVEVFHEELDQPEVKHKEVLAYMRSHFPCSSLSLHPVLLLKLLPTWSPLLKSLVKQSCFVSLCVIAHRQCLLLAAPLHPHPPHPSVVYQPLDLEFIRTSSQAIQTVLSLATKSQLQDSLQHCHSLLKPIVTQLQL